MLDSDDDNSLGRDFDFDPNSMDGCGAFGNAEDANATQLKSGIKSSPSTGQLHPAPLPTQEPKKSKGKFEENDQQMIVKTGKVFKKKGFGKEVERKLTLTQQPRLFFSKADTGEYKCDIILTEFVSAVLKGAHKFEIICKKSNKVFSLKIPDSEDA